MAGKHTLEALLDIAMDWHGGASSPLYRFASRGGRIDDADHRQAILLEICAAAGQLLSYPPEDQLSEFPRLYRLSEHVKGMRTEDRRYENVTKVT